MTKSRSSKSRTLLLTSTLACSTSAAHAYVVKTLPLPSFPVISDMDIAGGQIVITACTWSYPYGPQHAYLWIPSSDSLIDLQPPGSASSAAMATNGVTQIGYASVLPSGPAHAMRWSGSAASAVDLHPVGAAASKAEGISPDGQIVGTVTISESAHAALWIGGNVVDLHPSTGYEQTFAIRTDGSHQVGFGRVSVTYASRALVWSGSADSVLNLHPTGFAGSMAQDLHGSQVVGYASLYGSGPYYQQLMHAAVWDLTTGTFTDLNGDLPQSAIIGTNGSTQVGAAQLSADGTIGTIHAALWHGTADSYFDLDALLPSHYDYSRATGIDADGNISGVAFNTTAGRYEAVAWLVPEPAGVAFLIAAALAVTRRRRQPALATQVD